MKDLKSIIDEMNLESIVGGLGKDALNSEGIGLAEKRPQLLSNLADLLKSHGYDLALTTEAIKKLPLADKLALGRVLLADDLVDENNEEALADKLAKKLASIF